MLIQWSVLFLLINILYYIQALPVNYDATIDTVVIGSCNRHNLPQPLWQHINNITHGVQYHSKQQQKQSTDSASSIFVWLGDIVYADQHIGGLLRWPEHNMTRLNATYSQLKYHSEYTQLRNNIPIVGVYDDHDFGENDGNTNYKFKKQSQQVLLDFLDEPLNTTRREQAGAYTEYTIGSIGGSIVQIILLDVRYHQDYTADHGSGDMLGYKQWNWLQSTLQFSRADLILIGGGIQFIATDKPIGESWKNMPLVRYRLMRLLSTIDKPIILLSGDVHLAEMQRTFVCSPIEHSSNVRVTPLVDMTSSGMTHAIGIQKPFGWLGLSLFNKLLNFVTHKPVDEFYAGLNYGAIHINWNDRYIVTDIHDVNNNVVLHQKHTFDSLRTHTSDSLMSLSQSNYTFPFPDISLRQIQHICNTEDQRIHETVYNISGIKAGFLIIIMPLMGISILISILTKACRKMKHNNNLHQRKKVE